MKKILCLLTALIALTVFAWGQESIILKPHSTDRGFSVMKALSLRASAKEYDTAGLNQQDLSDLLWAANGINRPDVEKRTAPSAMNAQDIDVYVFMKSGIYLYEAKRHALDPVLTEDHRKLLAGRQENVVKAPVICLLVSDISRFRTGSDSLKLMWAAEDAGIVSQNISIFCASVGLETRPRASMEQDKLRQILKLKDSQHLLLNHPVSKKQ